MKGSVYIKTPNQQRAIQNFESIFSSIEQSETVDDVSIYKGKVRIPMKLRGEIALTFPVTIRLTQMNQGVKVYYKIHPTQIIIIPLIIWIFFSGAFYFIQGSWQMSLYFAFLSLLLGIILWVGLSKGVTRLESEIKRIGQIETDDTVI